MRDPRLAALRERRLQATKKGRKVTKYKVLNKSKDAGWLELTGVYEGPNAKAAIQAALKSGNGSGDPSGEYVAVPARSWEPVKVKAETALKFS